MLKRGIEAIEGKIPFISGLLDQRRAKERAIGERTASFFNFMRTAGINVDQLRPELVAEWISWSGPDRIKISEQSLDIITGWHGAFLRSDTHIQFERLAENEGGRSFVTHVKQNVQTNPKYYGELSLDFAGVITGISQIMSSEEDPKYSPFISFKGSDGLGFDLYPDRGGIVLSFVGDQLKFQTVNTKGEHS